LYLSALKEEMPESDRTIYTAHWQQGISAGRAHRQTSNGLCNRQHHDKLRYYIGDDPTVLDLLANVMNGAVNANYQCQIKANELLSPPSHRILPAVLDGSDIRTLNMLSQYMARGQLPEHVLQHFEVSSVLIYENWNVVPNPPGYPHYQQVAQLRACEGRPDLDMDPNIDVEDDDNAVRPARGNRLTI
jgi:hypothetical protein